MRDMHWAHIITQLSVPLGVVSKGRGVTVNYRVDISTNYTTRATCEKKSPIYPPADTPLPRPTRSCLGRTIFYTFPLATDARQFYSTSPE